LAINSFSSITYFLLLLSQISQHFSGLSDLLQGDFPGRKFPLRLCFLFLYNLLDLLLFTTLIIIL